MKEGRINYELLFGNFDLNVFNGDVRFRFSVRCNDIELPEAIVRYSIVTPACMFDKYAKGIVSVIYSGATGKQAINLCEEPVE